MSLERVSMLIKQKENGHEKSKDCYFADNLKS